MSDEALKQHFREATRPLGREGCPTAGDLVDAGEGRPPGPQRRLLAQHLAVCSACAREYRLARALHLGAQAPSDPTPRTLAARPTPPGATPFWRRWYAWAPVAAAIALALILPLTLLRGPEPTRAILRGQGGPLIRSGVPHDALLPRERFVLRWSGPQGARYSVKLALPDLTVLARARGLVAGELRVPAGALVKVPRGTRMLWSVTAVLGDGSRIASPIFGVRVE